MLRAIRFYKEIRQGSSLPVLVGGDDGHTYVVKLNGAGDGVLANVVEWVASKLGALMQIPVLQPVFVVIAADFAEQAEDPETRELLEKSAGINLGTPYLPGASTFNQQQAPRFDDFLKQQIFLFDVFLLNVDRTQENPNMIVHHDKLWCLDYSSAMEMRSAITGESYREYMLLKHLKRHPFYQENPNVYGFIKQLREFPNDSLRAILDGLPAEWISYLQVAPNAVDMRRVLTETLIDKMQQGITVRNRLDLLRALHVETAEEARQRTSENRKFFEQKYGSL